MVITQTSLDRQQQNSPFRERDCLSFTRLAYRRGEKSAGTNTRVTSHSSLAGEEFKLIRSLSSWGMFGSVTGLGVDERTKISGGQSVPLPFCRSTYPACLNVREDFRHRSFATWFCASSIM